MDDRQPHIPLKHILDWPTLQSVYAPRVRVQIHAMRGGMRLNNSDRIRNTYPVWERRS